MSVPIDDLSMVLLVLIGLRFLASLVFLELFWRHREDKYAVLALAWLVYMVGPLAGLIAYGTSGDADHPLFAYSAAVGTLLLLSGVFLYYRALARSRLLVGVVAAVATLGVIILLYPQAGPFVAVLAQLAFLCVTLMVLIFRRDWFLTFGGNSYYWLFPIVLFSLVHAIGFTFIYSDAPFSVRLLVTCMANLSLIIFFLHFEYHRSLLQLGESEERYRFLFNAAPIAMWEEDAAAITARFDDLRARGIADLRQLWRTQPRLLEEMLQARSVLDANQETVSMLEAASKQEYLNNVEKTFRPESYEAFAEAVACLYEGASQTTLETVVQTLRGTRRDVMIDVHFPSQGDSNQAAVVSMVDITERKQAEEALKGYSERLEEMVQARTLELQAAQEELIRREKLAVLGQLAGGVGHELRNPLGVISNAIYYLKMINTDADQPTREYLDIIASEVEASTQIISDLLDFARTKAVDKGPVSLTELVDSSLTKVPASDNVLIKTMIPPDLPPVVVDGRQIEQVLVNLVTNAYQAMPEGGTLTIRGQEEGSMVAVSVSDTGQGIAAENLDKVFEPLFTTKARGIGLGLALSQSLVTANGGQISVESVEGQGTTFTLTLPTREGA